MNFINKILDRRFYHILSVLALTLIYHEALKNYEWTTMLRCSLIVLLELVLLWTKKTWWNTKKYILISFLTITMALILQYRYNVQTFILLWPLVWAFGAMDAKHNKLSLILGFSTIAIILFMSHNSPLETLFNLLGIYFGIRSIRIRQDAYRTSQLHLNELNQAHKELQEAHAELLEASVHSMRYAALEERTRLAREIHDGIGHQLTSLIVQLQALEIMLTADPEKASELVSQLLQVSRKAMAEVRHAVREWSDDEMGLGLVALKGLVSQTQARSSIQFNFIQDSDISEWPIETSIVLYRIVQESLTNILRHSNALLVKIHIKEKDDQLFLTIADDGEYTEINPITPGFGLKGIIERCQKQGGTCAILPEKPHGLRIEVMLPIEIAVPRVI